MRLDLDLIKANFLSNLHLFNFDDTGRTFFLERRYGFDAALGGCEIGVGWMRRRRTPAWMRATSTGFQSLKRKISLGTVMTFIG